jgi:hypothetical protein
MDTSKVKTDPKQEAETGLLVRPKVYHCTTASSEEDRLAAGISTIRLQARKLSEAQRKETLKGQHFSLDAEVEAAVHKWISSQPENFFMDGMNKWIND